VIGSLLVCFAATLPSSFAYALREVANHTMTCGEHVIRFGPDALIASLDGMRTEVRWDRAGMAAEIGEFKFVVEQYGGYEYDGEACTLSF
jgi:hypothetical protein